ncbi:MAG: hypothetical protein AB1374_04505 [Bacillota bacterium]
MAVSLDLRQLFAARVDSIHPANSPKYAAYQKEADQLYKRLEVALTEVGLLEEKKETLSRLDETRTAMEAEAIELSYHQGVADGIGLVLQALLKER